MGYFDIIGTKLEKNELFSALLELTYRCNLDCVFCYNDVSLAGKPMRLADYEALLDDLASLGVMNVTLTGGEPLAHPEFFAIGAAARERGFVVRVKSNGHALGAELAKRLRDEVDPFVVEVSLHGATAATHERQTRVEGSFERLLRNVAEMQGAGLRVRFNGTLTRWNEAEIEGMFAIADGLGTSLNLDPSVTPRDDGDLEPLELRPTPSGIARFQRFMLERYREHDAETVAPATPARPRRAPTKHCGAGSTGVAVDPYGNVYPCVQWRRRVGNLRETRLKDMWSSSPVLGEVREATAKIARDLHRDYGERAPFLHFCPGEAETITKSPFTIYDAARERVSPVARTETAEGPRTHLRVLG